MPPSNQSPARRRRRSLAAAISGLAIGAAGVGVAAGPAVADPSDPGGAPPAASAGSSAAADGTHSVTLITGDRVRVTDNADGTHAVEIETAVPGAAVQTVEIGDDLHVVPQSALPYLASGAVDRDLFNISRLIEFGYDDASVDATPVIVEFADGPTTFSAPAPGIQLGAPLGSIDGAAASAEHASAATTWNALTGSSDAATFSSEATLGGGIEAIHLDGKVQATLDGSVPWIGAPEAWAAGYTGDGVTVAVLDTGYDDTHPDLAGRVLPDSASFVPGEEVAADPNGHGTHVASTIAGSGAASSGTHRGVADGAGLLVGKVLGADGYGQDSWIIEAMQWAGERADIVSMSLGSPIPSDGSDVMSEALNAITEETGALFVVAAGNAGSPEAIGAPGAAAKALTVGSVEDPSGALSYFSNQGPLALSGALKPELVGPGSDITAARSADSPGEGSYVGMSGTSMATPHVAGAAAILKHQHPEYGAEQLRAALLSSATDVGLTSYQGGSGVVDVDAAVDATVIATGSGDFGMLVWGEEAEPVVRTVEYANHGDADVVLELDASLQGAEEGVFTMDDDELTIPAGESRSVTMTVDPSKVPAGTQLSGALVASIDGTPVARTALGTIAERERYDLTVTATGFDGEPVATHALLYDVDHGDYHPFFLDGELTVRMPAGEYAVVSFMEVNREADSRVTVFAADPDLILDADATVALDARATHPVTVDVGDDGVVPWFSRIGIRADDFSTGYIDSATSDGFYAQPMEAPNAETFDFTARWRLQEPMLSLKAGKEVLDLIVQGGSTLAESTFKAGAVDVGRGSAAEFAATPVAGKVAVVTRSSEVSASERAANAAAAGAAVLLVVNDADGEFGEWVGADDGTEVGIPVASVSGVQGRRLLDAIATRKVTVTGASEPAPEESYDIARFHEGSIPEDLGYAPTDLARIDTTYHGQTGELVGEFRWDYAPGVQFSSGFLLRTERGITREEWVNTDQVEWIQGAVLADAVWEVRDMRRAYEAGQREETTYFGPIVRPFVGPGYWAPMREGDYAQINVPSWADGGDPHHTGAFDVFQPVGDRSQLMDVWVDGELRVASDPWQAAVVFDLPEGESEFRVVNTAVHDGSFLPSSTRTVTEWTFRSIGSTADYTPQTLPMMQAYYDVEADAAGAVGTGRKAGAPVELGLELSHIEDAVGMAELTGATLEMRVAGGDWRAVDLVSDAPAEGAPSTDGSEASPMLNYPVERPFLEAYTAKLAVPDSGAWIDLRVTATDAAGNTFSQEIERAFEAAPAKKGTPRGGRP